MSPALLRYRTIDDYLGSSDGRFFGAGYRRADYELGPVRIDPDAAQATAWVSVSYPTDWSRKGNGGDLRPHLSTVDAVVLAVQMCEVYLANVVGVDRSARRQAWLRKVTIRAGASPQEELDHVPLSIRLRETTDHAGPASVSRSVFDCKVGALRGRCVIDHLRGVATASRAVECSVGDVLAAANRRYYGEGFKARRHAIRDVAVDLDALQAGAQVEVYAEPGSAPVDEGIEGGYQPGVSMIDAFVTNLQLAQVLLYELDAVDRRESNTLWMLQTALEAETPRRPVGVSLAAETGFSATRLLNVKGAVWRNVDITSRLAGIVLRSSFAHQLRDAAPTGETERNEQR